MKRIWIARGFAVSSALGLAGVVASFASCATQDNTSGPFPADDGAVLPESSPPVSTPEAGPEAGCDAAAADCTSHVVTCDEVAWCAVDTKVSPFYALAAVWGSSANDVWAVGSGGTIIHWDGKAWAPTDSGVHNTFYGVWGSGPNDLYAVSSTDVIVHSTGIQPGGGAAWKVVPTDLGAFNSAFVRAIWGSSPSDVRIGGRAFDLNVPEEDYFGTGDQFVKRTTADGGIAWRPLPSTYTVTSIWGSSANDVWMTADNSVYVPFERGKTLHGTLNPDAGGAEAGVLEDRLTWRSVDSQSSLTLESVWGSSASDVWAVGGLGTIRHITPGDLRWQPIASPTKETLHGVWGSGPNDIWAVGDAGTILHWDGTSFKTVPAELPLGKKPKLNGIWGSGPNDVWIVGDGIALHYTGAKK